MIAYGREWRNFMSMQDQSINALTSPKKAGGSFAGERIASQMERRTRVRSGNRKRINFLKFALPIMAFGLIGFLVVWPSLEKKEEAVPLAFSDVADLNDDLRMISPRFVGVDGEGRPYVLTADVAIQGRGDATRIVLDELQADISLQQDVWLSLSAAEGLYMVVKQQLNLESRVSIFSDIGYELHAENALVDLKNGTINSTSPITGQGPLGTIEAGALSISGSNTGGVGNIVFFDGVKLTLFLAAQS
jgi:lipopolysaccharide export system protein LptC